MIDEWEQNKVLINLTIVLPWYIRLNNNGIEDQPNARIVSRAAIKLISILPMKNNTKIRRKNR